MNHHAAVSVNLPTSAEKVFQALTAYGCYKDWVPGIKESQVLVREGDIVVVEFEAPRFSSKPVTFEFVQNAPVQVIFQQVGQYREQGLFGRWNIASGPTANEVQLQGRAEVRAPVYMFSAKKQLQTAMNDGLEALREYIGVPSAVTRREEAVQRLKILEVRRHQDGLEVWYQGRIFTCPADQRVIKT